jgi:hypothetical protein
MFGCRPFQIFNTLHHSLNRILEMTQSNIAGLADPTTKLLGNVIVIHRPPSNGCIGIGIPATTLADSRLWWGVLLDLPHYLVVPSEALVAYRMTLQGIAPPLVFMKFRDRLDLAALVADATRYGFVFSHFNLSF